MIRDNTMKTVFKEPIATQLTTLKFFDEQVGQLIGGLLEATEEAAGTTVEVAASSSLVDGNRIDYRQFMSNLRVVDTHAGHKK